MTNWIFNQLGITLKYFEDPNTKFKHRGDCVTFTLSSVLGTSYKDVSTDLAEIAAEYGLSSNSNVVVSDYLRQYGFKTFRNKYENTDYHYILAEFLMKHRNTACIIAVQNGIYGHIFYYHNGIWVDSLDNIMDGSLEPYLPSEDYLIFSDEELILKGYPLELASFDVDLNEKYKESDNTDEH